MWKTELDNPGEGKGESRLRVKCQKTPKRADKNQRHNIKKGWGTKKRRGRKLPFKGGKRGECMNGQRSSPTYEERAGNKPHGSGQGQTRSTHPATGWKRPFKQNPKTPGASPKKNFNSYPVKKGTGGKQKEQCKHWAGGQLRELTREVTREQRGRIASSSKDTKTQSWGTSLKVGGGFCVEKEGYLNN